jgi:5-formyltetrahydrofolate cyclo-ligase
LARALNPVLQHMTLQNAATGAEKRGLRETAKRKRADAFHRHGAAASRRLTGYGIAFALPRPGATVSGFLAIGEEIDPLPLLLHLDAAGFLLSLPAMPGKDKPLVFRTWVPGDPLVQTTWGIREPLVSAAVVVPEIVLVPLLAFDRAGHRLGYGGGYFDRTLGELRATRSILAIGLAFDEQEVETVPHLAYDQRLDWVLTPSGPRQCIGP